MIHCYCGCVTSTKKGIVHETRIPIVASPRRDEDKGKDKGEKETRKEKEKEKSSGSGSGSGS